MAYLRIADIPAFAESLGLEMLHLAAGIRIYPDTPLARLAVAEGRVDAHDDLLRPRFYVRPELDGLIRERVARHAPGTT
jgi:hypothetical protein